MIAIQHVGGDDLGLMARNGRQRRAAQRPVARRINRRVGHTLEKRIQLETALLAFHARRGQIERIEIGDAARRMHHEIGREHLILPVRGSSNR